MDFNRVDAGSLNDSSTRRIKAKDETLLFWSQLKTYFDTIIYNQRAENTKAKSPLSFVFFKTLHLSTQ